MRKKYNGNDEDQLTFGTMDDGAKGGSMDDFLNDIDKMLEQQEKRKEPAVRRGRTGAREVTIKRRVATDEAFTARAEANKDDQTVPASEQTAEQDIPACELAPTEYIEPLNEQMPEAEPEKDCVEPSEATSHTEPEHEEIPQLKAEPEPEQEPEPEAEPEPEQESEHQEQVAQPEAEPELDGAVIDSDIEQEELMRQKRMALFAKPDILLETPYVITVGNKQYTRYRLEFGRPDSNIPPELSTSAGSYVPKIEEVDEKEVLKRKRKIRNKNILREVSSWVSCIIIAVVIALLINNFVFSFVRVQGDSMLDTLNKDNWLFVWRAGYIFDQPKRGDVVICHFDQEVGEHGTDTFFIKRVIGLPGETVSIQDGFVYVNGSKLEEDYLTELRRDNEDMEQITLGEGQYFVLGDNRINSTDSRLVGPIAEDKIIGKAVQKLLPINQFGPVE